MTDLVNLPLTVGQLADLNAGTLVSTFVPCDRSLRCYRVRVDGEWRTVHPSDVQAVYTDGSTGETTLVVLRPPRTQDHKPDPVCFELE
jgi:hypothetical protein